MNIKLQPVSAHPLLFSPLAQGETPTPTGFGELLRHCRIIHDPAEAAVEASALAMRVPQVSLGRGRQGKARHCLGLPQPRGGNDRAPPLRRREGTRERCGW